MRHTGGTWFGWSGETSVDPAPAPQILSRDGIRFTTIDLRPQDFELYYNGYCNSTLWPLFHYFTARFVHEQAQHDAYQNVNAQFASQLAPLLSPDDVVWVHDYHLIPLARQLRERGFEGPIGFFLHIPFPHAQILRLLPHFEDLVLDLCRYDLLGFQTPDDTQSFLSCVDLAMRGTARRTEDGLEIDGRAVRIGAYPIGVDVEDIRRKADAAVADETLQRLTASLLGRKLIVGIDRLDYSKGLTERFAAFEQFLESFPDNQGNVTFLQIAPLSRADVLAYGEIRAALERMAGRLNGRFAEADWTPIRYLNRNFSHTTSMGFLRASQVALVTPVRDGMNLVAKEFVAAQDPADPGVLVLSSMAGAARELSGALQVNPFDKGALARALQSALHMPLEERRQRHRQMYDSVRGNDIHHWYSSFLRDLSETRPASDPGCRPRSSRCRTSPAPAASRGAYSRRSKAGSTGDREA